ncbi:MAG: prepilin peptidase [Deltaproteobacteria bacterium]|nr:prepilin peptidase [Deltaproteobacteria bacterium]
MDVSRGIVGLWVFAAGACIGSFVNVVAYRLPRDISIVVPRSFCPRCGKAVPAWANVPILAYLVLRGRCAVCGGAIPFRYFLTELALASAALYLYLNFPPLDALARFVFCAALFVAALVDYDWRVIPSSVTFPGIPIGILTAWLVMPEVGWKNSVAGVAIGAGFLFVTGEVYLRLRGREGVGLGDVWLLAMVGAFLGLTGALFTLFAGSILGTIGGIAMWAGGEHSTLPNDTGPMAVGEVDTNATHAAAPSGLLQTEIPFGPFLAFAAAIFALFQPVLADWYFS